ncbi:hypothetical protein GCM10027405_29630 [Arthrobacter alkaliphilus]
MFPIRQLAKGLGPTSKMRQDRILPGREDITAGLRPEPPGRAHDGSPQIDRKYIRLEGIRRVGVLVGVSHGASRGAMVSDAN